ncbi:CNNM domain-containing protein [Colwellia hornerae]|uniref:HlyC/CorC family transporter n=1 Tax=Colwellia hornerae TaxID=89402 RepID=A0A5C6Q341_9GAMM|nr:hemolysin family protein [Colwellia hornerae]TWX47163.1 HlyC/CorC family transporter [Colwellia hornerae]TWX54340.1 HlyC/CorC family transporter [Colwellia hornerae]TWX63230.1 HlyC/CorC family transporter [Colwellia hornerae]
MFLLGLYLFIALFFSFLCSIAEAVLLSVSWVYVALIEAKGYKSGKILRALKKDINKPLAAILTLNTIAHTVGAAGVGAQAALVLEDVSLGVVSAVLTFLILVFSEIIPKTIGASYWKVLAPVTAHSLKFIIFILMPIIKVLELVTRKMVKKERVGFRRNEFSLMAQLSAEEGHIDPQEATILQNLLRLQKIKIQEVMTPRTVVFFQSQQLRVGEFFHKHKKNRFTRIPVYDKKPDNIIGFVIRADLLLAQARGNSDISLSNYVREMPTLLDNMCLLHAMKELLLSSTHISLIVNEYGTVRGILTLEDILETLIGHEIIDEGDKYIDMQKLAKHLWKAKAKKYGIKVEKK